MTHKLLQASSDIGGYPQLASTTSHDIHQALEEAVQAQKLAWNNICANSETPTFANTIEPLEDSYREFSRATGIYYTYLSSMGTPEILELSEYWEPKLAEHTTAMANNEPLATRIANVEEHNLTPEQQRVLKLWKETFTDAGAYLSKDAQQQLAALEAELAKLSAEFSKALLTGAQQAALLIHDEEELAGLDESTRERLALNAAKNGHEGAFLLPQDLFAAPALLESLENPATREKYYANSINRGRAHTRDAGSADTPQTIQTGAKMSYLRAQRAALFGAKNHAELTIRRAVAQKSDEALAMLEKMLPQALANFRKELETMAEVAGVPVEDIHAADVPYYLKRVAEEKYRVDIQALRPYFELNSVVERGVFYAAETLYGISFTEHPELSSYYPDMRVWEVKDENGTLIGIFALDPYARATKQGGAWMNDLVPRDERIQQVPVVLNTLNIAEPAEGAPALLTLDNVRTLFHEFGHALHSLLSTAKYPSVAGTNVPRDFVEYPSQVNEMWMFHPAVVGNYARHIDTGETLPQEHIDALRASEQWGEGFATSEYLGAALLDMAWHTRSVEDGLIDSCEDAKAFEDEVLKRYGFDQYPVSPRYLTGMFKHIFGGGYAAGYYAYIYSEMMDAETVDWFEESGGATRHNGETFKNAILATGNSQDPAESFRQLRGRDPRIEPLLRRRGLLEE
ncbi:M3 family metallopeptidase [Rothia sp. P13129]|uniref:M3 family metallopeptidase n=1 Tax=Rothia sp. P13129 TaxID=3402664 RepID=UPI003AD71869